MAPADGVEAVLELVLVDHGRERADLFELVGGRHQDAAVGAQPAPIIETVHGDEAHAGGDVVLEPAIDLGGIEIVAVGMAHRDVDRADLAAFAPGDADAADIAAMPRPGRAAVGAQALVVRLGVDRDDADAAQIGQLGGWAPMGPGGGFMSASRNDLEILG